MISLCASVEFATEPAELQRPAVELRCATYLINEIGLYIGIKELWILIIILDTYNINHMDIRVYIYIPVHIYIPVCIYIHIHTHINIYMLYVYTDICVYGYGNTYI